MVVLRRRPWTARMVVATLVEAGWEILENSPRIIDRCRSVTMAWGYRGDSVLNPISDIACILLGFTIARRLPWWASAGLIVMLEIVARIAPVDAIRVWQAG